MHLPVALHGQPGWAGSSQPRAAVPLRDTAARYRHCRSAD
jgi:hypothetical protein